MSWSEAAGGRKFIMAAGSILLAFVLALLGKLTSEFTSVLIACTGFYSAANAVIERTALQHGSPDAPVP